MLPVVQNRQLKDQIPQYIDMFTNYRKNSDKSFGDFTTRRAMVLKKACYSKVLWAAGLCWSNSIGPQLHQMLTDFQNLFPIKLSNDFVTKQIQTHTKYVTTLPCKKFTNFLISGG